MARGLTNFVTFPIVSSCGVPDMYVVVTILDPDVSDELEYTGHNPSTRP